MDSACDAERRAFLGMLATTTAALAVGGCGGASGPSSGGPPAANLPPVWQTMPTVTFTHGVASSVSIASSVSDPNGNSLTIAMTSGTLPAGVTFDAAGKRFVYDGNGALGSTTGVVLTANDGQA